MLRRAAGPRRRPCRRPRRQLPRVGIACGARPRRCAALLSRDPGAPFKGSWGLSRDPGVFKGILGPLKQDPLRDAGAPFKGSWGLSRDPEAF